jgi:hypothetical protein
MRFPSLLLFLPALLGAQELVPLPRKITQGSGQLLVDVRTAVIAPAELTGSAEVLATALQKTTGFLHRIRTPEQVGRMRFKRAIRLSLDSSMQRKGSYRLKVTPEGATITAGDPTGVMHGAQTLANLLPVSQKNQQRALLSAMTIEDHPETSRRIFHLDVGSHLFPTDDLKSLIDWLSFHKINEFHLQLNNNHGWRMESLAFPKLHKIGSVRSSTPPYGDRSGSDSTEYGGFYTQDKMRELVKHARKREVRIIPGFSLTTGAAPIIAAYPELGEQPARVVPVWKTAPVGLRDSESTLNFLDKLFTEVAGIFPDHEIRLEGPKAPLHSRIESLLAKGQTKLFWADSLPSTDLSRYPRPAPDELLIDPKREAEGGFNPVSQVYQIKTVPGGAQATLRTEFVHDFEKLEYLVFPRLAAFAEATWLPADSLNYEDFRNRLQALQRRYRDSGIIFSEPYDPPVAQTLHNTVVRTSMTARSDHPAQLIFDGRPETFFRSANHPRKDDHLTLEFPWAATGTVSVTTGLPGTTTEILESGMLELSADGQTWHTSVPFIAGTAESPVRDTTRFLRIRASDGQDHPLILHEVSLSEPLLAPLHEESRSIELPITKKKITLTFRADFRDHPGLRASILEARAIYFSEWLPLARKLGVSHEPKTPRDFEIEGGEPNVTVKTEVRRWMLSRMIPWLQNYPETAPDWFQSGLASLLLEDLPAQPKKSKYLEGGPESAAFLKWIEKTYGGSVLTTISSDCQRGQYRDILWNKLTQKSLEELAEGYRASN